MPVFSIVMVTVLLPVYGVVIGVYLGNKLEDILFDLQPYIYMMMILYLCFNNNAVKEYAVLTFINISKIFALLASFIYIFYMAMLYSGYLNFNAIYSMLSQTGEFFFRPSGAFFSKSFFFIGIGAIIFFCEKKYYSFIFCAFALFLTETRGVFIFTCLAIMLASMKVNTTMKNVLLIALLLIAGAALALFVGSRAGDSDAVRLNDIRYIINNISTFSLIFGEGFGSLISGRSRIEVVPLELLYKVGLFGIILSLTPLFFVMYKSLFKTTELSLKIGCIALFAAGVSLTNPFLYTPMGIYILGVSIITLNRKI